jgi:adenylate cyclase
MNSLIRRAQQVGLARAICVLLLFALVPLRLADPRPLQELRARTFDFFQVLRPRPQEIRPVVIVDIDEASLKAIGQWPWPRTTVADLVTQITQLGAVAIGFDIIFPEPDRMSPAIAERSFRGIDAETRAKLDSLPSNDEALADVIKHSRVVIGQAGAAAPEVKTTADAALQTGFAVRGPDARPYMVTFAGLLRNVPVIEQAAAGRGLFSINPESDGIIRRVPVIMTAQGSLVPSLSLEMLRVVTGSSAILVRVDEAGVQSVAVPGLEVPTDRNGQFWVHQPPRPGALHLGQGRITGQCAAGPPGREACPDRHLGDRIVGSQDHAARCRNPGRRSARPNSGKRAQQVESGEFELRDRRRACPRRPVRACDHCRRADAAR